MDEFVIKVEGMHCDHCASAIKAELMEVNGVFKVEVDLAEKTVTVKHEEGCRKKDVEAVIRDLGYEVIEM